MDTGSPVEAAGPVQQVTHSSLGARIVATVGANLAHGVGHGLERRDLNL